MSFKKTNCKLIICVILLAGFCCTESWSSFFDTKSQDFQIDTLKSANRPRLYELQPRTGKDISFTWLLNTNEPRVIDVQKINGGVSYVFDNGERIERRGGTIAWRNNNPGCIRYSANAVSMGAVGHANGFAVFPDETTGMRAIETLLKSENYRHLTITNAITKYAPPHENNTTAYIDNVCRANGLNKDQKIRDLSDSLITKVAHTIRKLEGWREGSETIISAPQPPELTLFNTTKKTIYYQIPTKTL